MSTDTTSTANASFVKTSTNKKWVYALIVLLVIAAVGYFAYISRSDRFSNHDYYRVLYEASNRFNESLIKLDRMHSFEESVPAIRSLLPSYKRTIDVIEQETDKEVTDAKDQIDSNETNANEETTKIDTDFQYELRGKELVIEKRNEENRLVIKAELDFEDILPLPKQGFSQYLFADSKGKVLATAGKETAISVVDLTSIKQQLARKSMQFQLTLSETGKPPELSEDLPLPSYSSHVDMALSYGEFRIFIFPFSPATQVKKEDGKSLEQLYLVGLIPTAKLVSNRTNHWNISLLVASLVSLFFMWNLLRLMLLPANQSITRSFRHSTIISSYLFYIVIFALALAYLQKYVLQESKDLVATEYGKQLKQSLDNDLLHVFKRLDSYRPFYIDILKGLKASEGQILTAPKDLSKEQGEQPASDEFNSYMKSALQELNHLKCADPENKLGLRPNYAAHRTKLYRVHYQCPKEAGNTTRDTTVDQDLTELVNLQFDTLAQSILVNAFVNNRAKLETVDFYAGNLIVELDQKLKIDTFVEPSISDHIPGKLLTAFALNGEGNSTLPSIYFQESNALPSTFNLSHRDYYKKVRDQRGWDLTLDKGNGDVDTQQTFRNVYIQRLLNVNNGTRGTTISMPLIEPSNHDHIDFDFSHYIIGADVLLPSLSLGKPAPQDFVYMVAERTTGDVIFHSDSNRSLVENLYFTGNTTSDLGQWLKAGLDNHPELGSTIIDGHYHGQAGRFALITTSIDNWAIVVFYPDDSLNALMTNQFLYVSVTFLGIMMLLSALIFGIRHFVLTSVLKRKLYLPENCNIRLLMLLFSILLSISFCLFYLGQTLDLDPTFNADKAREMWSIVSPMAGIIILAFLVYKFCSKYFSILSEKDLSVDRARQGSIVLVLTVVTLLYGHLVYMKHTASMPMYSLAFHYKQLSCNWLNHERRELVGTGLGRYPNSITRNRENPLDLLPIEPEWRKELKYQSFSKHNDPATESLATSCAKHLKYISPEDYPSLTSLVGATYMWKWINGYLNDQDASSKALSSQNFNVNLHPALLIVLFISLVLIILGWLFFNVKILWNRLYCPERFLRHIKRMTNSVTNLNHDERSQRLTIECDTIKLNGIGLALLLRNMTLVSSSEEQSNEVLLTGFKNLYSMSPCLQKLSNENRFLPNIKLNVNEVAGSSLLDVQIWDIEICLEKVEFRQLLLDLIMELKSLTLSNKINSFTLITGFHSLQRVKMKDPLSNEPDSLLEHAEYLSWADCLMDFTVVVPDSFKLGLDLNLLKSEVENFPELQFLLPKEDQNQDSQFELFWRSEENKKIESKWTTINYILLNADALYRFKWESCSRAEKLALFNLAKDQRLNPTNTQMIEHLAINGLITVRKGHIGLINRSFRHFVLHAETSDTLNQLVKNSEAGTWKNYRLPLGIIILLLVAGIAMTSGESIYIIAASVAGILGTIASVTNSASMLKGQFRE
jgi:hypothetical protein